MKSTRAPSHSGHFVIAPEQLAELTCDYIIEPGMDLSSIHRRKTVALALILLSTAGIAFAHETAIVSPPLTVRPGTILTIRINQSLSSDHNQVGDVFYATLAQPVIANGIVVAHGGQAVTGRVTEVKKAGRVSGVSHLGITLTSLTAADGQTVPIQSQLLIHQGSTSRGRDAAAVATTTGLGAAIAAAADWGTGAAIGAGIGAAAGTIGVLLTRGNPTVIYPDTLVTFQVTAPATVVTNDAPQAFRFVERADDAPEVTPSQRVVIPQAPPQVAYPYSYPYAYYAPPAYPYYYPYYGYPYYYGPSVSFFFGYPGYYGYRGFYGHPGYGFGPGPFHGFHGGWHR